VARPSKGRPARGAPVGELRIIGGRFRSRRLRFPALAGLRPTPDRVRETLFNWLQPHVPGARCLDLFAGSGALGLEALSRGAGLVVFVEQAPVALTALEQNCALLDVRETEFVLSDALAYLARPPTPFDLVFVDPPFQSDLLAPALDLLDRGWIRAGGLVYIEAPAGRSLPLPAGWTLWRSKQAGQVTYSLAKKD
jgi:16S rRNA (guanine966-N2)-methyltransferase